jgi:membrane-associated phospholipid phosphatase
MTPCKFTLAALSITVVAMTARADGVERAGDVLQLVVPAVALGMTYQRDDAEGRTQFAKAFATNLGATYALKYTVDARRPNGGEHSFPSGHTSVAFQGAAFLHARYGWETAWPAYAAAAFVGYSRVDSRNHYTRDVVAGAALGVASSLYFTRPYTRNSGVILPLASSRDLGLVYLKAF